MKNLNKNQKGFTMLELLISIAIIGIMATLSVLSYASINRTQQVKMSAQEFASNVRKAQNYAMALKKPNSSVDAWGIYIKDAKTYIIYANMDGSPNNVYSPGDYIAETIILPGKVTINNISSSIHFDPPDPTTIINGSTDPNIKITFTDGTRSKEVLVNTFGLVDVLE